MREDIKGVLDTLSFNELTEAATYIEELIGKLESSGGAAAQTAADEAERREFERFPMSVHATFLRHQAAGKGRSSAASACDAVVRDISRGGVRFTTGEAVEPDEVLTLYLPGPKQVRKFLIVQVRWAQLADGEYECGAQLVSPDRAFAGQAAAR